MREGKEDGILCLSVSSTAQDTTARAKGAIGFQHANAIRTNEEAGARRLGVNAICLLRYVLSDMDVVYLLPVREIIL